MYFFFFQAEDGIRDKLVTGVQTCALPISARGDRLRALLRELRTRLHHLGRQACLRPPRAARLRLRPRPPREGGLHPDRSEEHTSELQSLAYLVCRLLLEKKKNMAKYYPKFPISPTTYA